MYSVNDQDADKKAFFASGSNVAKETADAEQQLEAVKLNPNEKLDFSIIGSDMKQDFSVLKQLRICFLSH